MDKASTKTSSWFRGFDIIVGLVLIVSSVVLFLSYTSSPAMIVNLLTISILLLGLSKLISGIVTEEVSMSYRWINIASGAILILLALYAYFFPPVSTGTTVSILMVGLLLYGINSFVVGFVKGFSGSVKALLIVAGVISVVASLWGFFDTTLASVTAASFITLALLADGVEEMTAGVTGHTAF